MKSHKFSSNRIGMSISLVKSAIIRWVKESEVQQVGDEGQGKGKK
jgi:hypothetical protein